MSRLAAIVSPDPGGRGGGVEHHVGLMADLLRDKGWRVKEVGGPAQQAPWARRLALTAYLTSKSATAPLADLNPDLVITNGTLGAGVPRSVKAPRIHVYHGTMVGHVLNGEDNLVRREYYRRAITNGLVERAGGRRGATTVAVSQQVAEEVARYYRIEVDAVIETCADFEHFKPRSRSKARKHLGLDEKAKLALFVGRLEYRKGADMLEEICRIADCELMVAGEDAPAGAVHLGQLGHDELPWAYAAADAVIFPTRYEGCSFVVLESLACERPLVSTRTGWAPTLAKEVPGYAPFILEPEVQPLAHALRRALEAPGDVPVQPAAEYVRTNLSLERFRERWSDLIDSVA